MPELPEIHSAAKLINETALNRWFRGPVVRSEVSKSAPFEWKSTKFKVEATARGKELQMVLKDHSDEEAARASDLRLTFNFGMSGRFSFDRFDLIPKHAHLQFFTVDNPAHVLSFVDYRRFGKWVVRDFEETRSPDPVLDYANFRRKVLSNLNKAVFSRAICEAIMDQEYFNGIGNYLRAEILYRARIPPFTETRSVLEGLSLDHEIDPKNPDVLDLCHLVPKEVFAFIKPGEGYNPDLDQYATFRNWLQCYMKPSMKNLVDRQKRTIWFDGTIGAGPMLPKVTASRHGGKQSKAKKQEESEDDKEEDDVVEEKAKSRGSKAKKLKIAPGLLEVEVKVEDDGQDSGAATKRSKRSTKELKKVKIEDTAGFEVPSPHSERKKAAPARKGRTKVKAEEPVPEKKVKAARQRHGPGAGYKKGIPAEAVASSPDVEEKQLRRSTRKKNSSKVELEDTN